MRQLSLKARIRYDQRVVWSAECGGCLMLQRRTPSGWTDFSSSCEGEFPVLDAATRRVVAQSNRNLQAYELEQRAQMHERHAAELRGYAAMLKAGPRKRERPRGMTAYERAERAGDAY